MLTAILILICVVLVLVLFSIIYTAKGKSNQLNCDTIIGELEKIISNENNRLLSSINMQINTMTVGVKELNSSSNESIRILIKELIDYEKDKSEISERRMNDFYNHIDRKISAQTETLESTLNKLTLSIATSLNEVRQENEKQMEKMREVVDEKLSKTLNERLTSSFKRVDDALSNVHKSLGEMQVLASNVDDLKKVLSNVKARGTWGEISLNNIVAEILTPDQYHRNQKLKPNSNDMVDFAIILPGKDDSDNVYLPIDCKFPIEAYSRLVEASEKGNREIVELSSKQLINAVKENAKSIKNKYIEAPYTTDFAIMYMPIEGLYAEIARKAGLIEELQNRYRVIIAGPTTIIALLNSLQMGFQTLRIEKNSKQIYELLTALKKDFGTFNELLQKAQSKLFDASSELEKATKRTEIIDRKLNKLE